MPFVSEREESLPCTFGGFCCCFAKWVSFAFIKTCTSRWISGASWRQSINSKSLVPDHCKESLIIQNIRYVLLEHVLMRGWSLWLFGVNILLCIKFLANWIKDACPHFDSWKWIPGSWNFTCTQVFLMWKLHRTNRLCPRFSKCHLEM